MLQRRCTETGGHARTKSGQDVALRLLTSWLWKRCAQPSFLKLLASTDLLVLCAARSGGVSFGHTLTAGLEVAEVAAPTPQGGHIIIFCSCGNQRLHPGPHRRQRRLESLYVPLCLRHRALHTSAISMVSRKLSHARLGEAARCGSVWGPEMQTQSKRNCQGGNMAQISRLKA